MELATIKREIREQSSKSSQKQQNDHEVINGLVRDMQNQTERQTELVHLIHYLKQEIHELKKN
jgi:hypothetical protein